MAVFLDKCSTDVLEILRLPFLFFLLPLHFLFPIPPRAFVSICNLLLILSFFQSSSFGFLQLIFLADSDASLLAVSFALCNLVRLSDRRCGRGRRTPSLDDRHLP